MIRMAEPDPGSEHAGMPPTRAMPDDPPSLPQPAATVEAMAVPPMAEALALIRARDPAADGAFVYGVTSTGVCCRPSCPSRPGRPDRIRLFPDRDAAIAAGFRPCRRCDARPATIPAAVAAAMDHLRHHADRAVPLAELAALAGLSAAHLHRRFTAAVGCSPRRWHAAWRERRVRELLRDGDGVAVASVAAGYGSGSRLYERAADRLGMTPGRYARGGAGEAISWAVAATAVGMALVAATDRGVCFVALGDDPAALEQDLRREFPAAALSPMARERQPMFAAWMDAVAAAAAAGRLPTAPLDLRGTPFQLRVWELLRTIPAGETWTYARLARALGLPRAARAVAGACAANRIALLVPCHRVIRGDGSLAGYRWDPRRKAALLAAERQAPA
jgi:AraC family transcriptional regulator of adaptative response/methylated-DNA-[protein]-cysteine methyltransferase